MRSRLSIVLGVVSIDLKSLAQWSRLIQEKGAQILYLIESISKGKSVERRLTERNIRRQNTGHRCGHLILCEKCWFAR